MGVALAREVRVAVELGVVPGSGEVGRGAATGVVPASGGAVGVVVDAGAWLAGRRLVSIDGTTFDVPDSDENDAFFGRPGTAKGERSAFPQARLVGLVECGTHAIIDAELGPYSTSEVDLARALVSRLTPGMLCVADRGFYGFKLWAAAAGTGADLLWRMRASQRLDPLEILPDGSYLAKIYDMRATGGSAEGSRCGS